MLVAVGALELNQLKKAAIAANASNFPKATAVIDEQLDTMYDTAYSLKCDMYHVKNYLDEMISSPSLSIHGEDITS